MARQSLQKVYADFRKGFVDVASPLQQPEGTVKDIVNFDINTDGSLSKRSGLAVTGGHHLPQYTDIDRVFLWKNVSNDVDRVFAVLYSPISVHFYDASEGNIDFSPEALVSTINIPTVFKEGSFDYDFAEALGNLYFACPRKGVGVFTYDEGSGKVTYELLDIKFRDKSLWEGADDYDTGIKSYSGPITPQHYYNLQNSGWPIYVRRLTKKEDRFEVTDGGGNPIDYFEERLGKWPRLSQSFYEGKSGGGESVREQMAFNPWNYSYDSGVTAIPPIGKFIYSLYDFTRESRYEDKRYQLSEAPSKIAFYAGRLWYAGEYDYDQEDISAKRNIYFSQDIRANLDNASKCYQDNDPTAEDINQLLATDGGFISIKELGEIKGMVPLGSALMVLTDKGIWSISGKDFSSFTADSFTVEKITDTKVISETSFVVSDTSVYFFAQEGLMSLTYGGAVNGMSLDNLSEGLIKRFTQDLPSKTLSTLSMTIDDKRGLITALMAIPTEEDDAGFSYETGKNTLLIFNKDTGAFYKYTINPATKFSLMSAVDGLYTGVVKAKDVWVDSADNVYIDSTGATYFSPYVSGFSENDITLTVLVREGGNGVVPAKFVDNTKFRDLGKPFEASVEIGFDSAQDLINDSKQAPYLAAYLGNDNNPKWEAVAPEPDPSDSLYPEPIVPVGHPYRIITKGNFVEYEEGVEKTYYIGKNGESLPPLFDEGELMASAFLADGNKVAGIIKDVEENTSKFQVAYLENWPEVTLETVVSGLAADIINQVNPDMGGNGVLFSAFGISSNNITYDTETKVQKNIRQGEIANFLVGDDYVIEIAKFASNKGIRVYRISDGTECYYKDISDIFAPAVASLSMTGGKAGIIFDKDLHLLDLSDLDNITDTVLSGGPSQTVNPHDQVLFLGDGIVAARDSVKTDDGIDVQTFIDFWDVEGPTIGFSTDDFLGLYDIRTPSIGGSSDKLVLIKRGNDVTGNPPDYLSQDINKGLQSSTTTSFFDYNSFTTAPMSVAPDTSVLTQCSGTQAPDDEAMVFMLNKDNEEVYREVFPEFAVEKISGKASNTFGICNHRVLNNKGEQVIPLTLAEGVEPNYAYRMSLL